MDTTGVTTRVDTRTPEIDPRVAQYDMAINKIQTELERQHIPNSGAQRELFQQLAYFQHERHLRTRDTVSLDSAIASLRKAAVLTNPGEPIRSVVLSNLGSWLVKSFRLNNNVDLLDEALRYLRENLKFYPRGADGRFDALKLLSSTLYRRTNHSSDADLLDEAIALNEERLQLCDGNLEYDRLDAVRSISSMLRSKYERHHNDVALLERALRFEHEVASLCSPGHPERPQILGNLAAHLLSRFQSTGDVESLREAIQTKRQALELCPPGSPGQAANLSTLGQWMTLLCNVTDDLVPLDQAIELGQAGLTSFLPGHPGRAHALRQLATSLSFKGKKTKNTALVGRAVELERESLDLMPPGHLHRIHTLGRLSSTLAMRGAMTRNREDVEEGITLQQEALTLCPPGNKSRANLQYDLSRMYVEQFKYTKDSPPLHLAVDALEDAINDDIAPAHVRLTGVGPHLDIIHRAASTPEPNLQDVIARLLPLYQSALTLLPHVAYFGLTPAERLSALASSDDLGLAAAAVACAMDEPVQAVELLERARAVFWSQALRLRTSLEELPIEDRDKLESVFGELERGSRDRGEGPAWSNPEVTRLRQLSSQAEKLIEEIRVRPGLQSFLRSQPYAVLARAAARGPVVVLLAHEKMCEALIVPNVSDGIVRLKLPALEVQEVVKLGERVRSTSLLFRSTLQSERVKDKSSRRIEDLGHLQLMDEGGEERKIRVAQKEKVNCSQILKQIWSRVVQSVLQNLGIDKSTGRDRPRLHWVPTGPFAFLPLHAAGDGNTWTSDFVVSSYAPTLAILLGARRNERPIISSDLRALLVAEPFAPGLAALPGAVPEITSIASLFDSERTTTIGITRPGPTTATVLNALLDASIFHLACHGEQHPTSPLQSGFALRDGRLSVAQLMQLNLPKAFLAFLSACDTAKGDENQPDQAVHLAAAMLFVGFRNVIATMWSMHDEDGLVVAQTVYAQILKTPTITADNVAYAIDMAVQKLREMGASPHRWAPYIHLGA